MFVAMEIDFSGAAFILTADVVNVTRSYGYNLRRRGARKPTLNLKESWCLSTYNLYVYLPTISISMFFFIISLLKVCTHSW